MRRYACIQICIWLAAASSHSLVGCASQTDAGRDGHAGASEERLPGALDCDEAVVDTESGTVKGTLAEGYRTFQGIPYAAPPVGARRWQPPAPVESWSDVRDASKPGSACAQGGGPVPLIGSEDCLYLNVTTPRGASAKSSGPKPVMVVLHGGAFVSGFGHRYDPHRLAIAGDVVVVTLNYRLGIFGFLAHPNVGGADFGLQDQLAALQWVKRNAPAFGGDANNVTLLGASAGGLSTCAFLTSPMAEGAFQRAILQSGMCTVDWPQSGLVPGQPAGTGWQSLPEARSRARSMAHVVGCDDPRTVSDCLRNIPTAELQTAVMTTPAVSGFSEPTYGTPILPRHPARALADGRFRRVPILSGSNLDEGVVFASAFYALKPITAERYRDLLRTSYGDRAAAVEEQYPLTAYPSPTLAWSAVITDRVVACPSFRGHRFLAARTSVHVFEFADRQAPPLLPVPPNTPAGATHASELMYLFDVLSFPRRLTPSQEELSAHMIRYWTHFARTGDPNDAGLPAWPIFDADTEVPHVQSLAPGAGNIRGVDMAAEHRCDFWSSIDR